MNLQPLHLVQHITNLAPDGPPLVRLTFLIVGHSNQLSNNTITSKSSATTSFTGMSMHV